MTELIKRFSAAFYGYGNPKADLWFVGMEEGCGKNFEQDIAPRFQAWTDRGEHTFEDLRAYHARIGITKHWEANEGESVRIQSTWRRLIEAVLAAQGNSKPSPADIAAYQANHLGSLTGDTCLAELLPLPSTSIPDWPYTHLAAELPHLASRPIYRKAVRADREKGLKALIDKHQPKHVVFYGRTYKTSWERVAGGKPFEEVKGVDNILRLKTANTNYWSLPHPNAHGLEGNPFRVLGELLRTEENSKSQIRRTEF